MIVPGSANPLLLAQSADPLDELGVIARSLRFRAPASAVISRTPGVAGNRQTWAARFYVKRGTLGVFQALMDATPATPATENTWLAFTAGDQLQFCQQTANVHVGEKVTNRVFRDTAAHIEIEIVFDSTNAVAADRMRIYVNGVRETSFATSVDIAQNALSYVNGANVHYIGGAPGTGIGYFDGLVSSAVITDGTMPDPSSFGQVHPRTGQRRPKSKAIVKAIADAGGTNSCFLPFDDATNTTTLCADASSKGNNWTATNVSLTAGVTYDSLTDTPTNNYPVLNATFANYGSIAGNITEGGLKFASSTTYHFTPCTMPLPTKGQWVAEFIPQDIVSFIGLADLDNGSGSSSNIGSGYGWYGSVLYSGVSAVQSGLASQAANDIITVAVDMDALSAKWYQNGVLRITQALTAGKRYTFACGDYYAPGATSCYANFGQRAFSYAPNGYKALCTKNLPVNPGGPMKSTNAFVGVTDTGANIAATLAAARTGWSAYIDIIKRRDAAEGWRWIFSDDPGYYMDSAGAAAKAAVPAYGGTSYVGYSLKVSAANGVATGRLVHVNGVADVVADGLSNSRKAIILVNEAGSNWYLYHPELTAGKLVYLNSTSVETVDATISSVTTSGFTVAAALASGTYRWIALAELEGFIKLAKTIGNGSADGFSAYAGQSVSAFLQKSINATANWALFDAIRDKQNVASGWLIPNTTSGESVLAAFDFDSNEVKCRYAGGSDINTAASAYAQIMIAAAPFRYANAR